MSGGSLADAFKKQRAFGQRRSLEIAADCARGMAYLHNKKPSPIVHRDLKPGNLMAAGSQYYKQCALCSHRQCMCSTAQAVCSRLRASSMPDAPCPSLLTSKPCMQGQAGL